MDRRRGQLTPGRRVAGIVKESRSCLGVQARTSDFAARVRSAVRRIPHGRVATYGDIAAAAGRPGAHRAVGNIMRATADSSVPCHRVIAAGGKLGGFGRDLFSKRALLLAEGVEVSGGRVRHFAEKRWEQRT